MSAAGKSLRAKSLAIEKATRSSMRGGGNRLRKELHAAAASATGGDRAYSGAGPRKLGVTVSVVAGRRTTTLRVKPQRKSAGQWVWANTGTKPGGRRHRRGNRKGMIMRHPGTKGRGAWTKTADRMVPQVIDDLRKEVIGGVR